MTLQPSVVLTPSSRRSRLLALAISAGLMLAFASVATAQAGHSDGVLECPGEPTYEVDGHGPAGFAIGSPGPWSGLFQLEGTTRVFKAFAITGQGFPYPSEARYPMDTIVCTLTSAGPGFPIGYWTLTGVFRP